MSLIQDALKRQQEEMNKKAAAAAAATGRKIEPPGQMPKNPLHTMNQPPFSQPAPSTAAPPPLPTLPILPTEESGKTLPLSPDDESRRPKALLPALAALILLFAFGFYFKWPYLNAILSPPPAGSTTPAAPVEPDSVAVASTPQSGEVAQASASTQAVAVVATPQTNPPPSLAGASATNGAESNLDLSASIATPVPVKEPPPALYVQPPKPVAAEPVAWPPLKLTGCINMGKSAIAIINGRMVEPGQTIDEVLLVSVNKNKNEALMRLDGEERVLRVGETAR